MIFAAASDTGIVRQINEDCYAAYDMGYPEKPICLIIADGMGGHNAGEIASSFAVDFIRDYVDNCLDYIIGNEFFVGDRIEEIFREANAEVYRLSQEKEEMSGMGTTLILALIHKDRIYIGHIGDSRVYLVREGEISQVTEDHSFIVELVKNGTITRAEAENHPKKHVITRALGCEPGVEADKYIYDLMDKDCFIFCTDGLSNMVSDKNIKEIILSGKHPEEACRMLISAANAGGGSDNITVIVVKV